MILVAHECEASPQLQQHLRHILDHLRLYIALGSALLGRNEIEGEWVLKRLLRELAL